MKLYSVYRHTAPNGKVYIGITRQKPKYRWGKKGKGYIGNKHFYQAIQKYGWENFIHEILYINLEKEEAQEIEISLIYQYKSADPNFGYNNSLGGEPGYYNKNSCDEEYHKHYRQEHRDKIVAYLKVYYRDNLEKASAENKKYHKEHAEEIKERHHKYYLEHKEEIIAKKKLYRERKRREHETF